jgi:hypothetical protein
MRTQQKQRSFDNGQRRDLDLILGAKAASRVLPKLEQAASSYKSSEIWFRKNRDVVRTAAERHATKAAKLHTRARRLLEAIDAAYLLMPDAVTEHYLLPGAPGPWVRRPSDLARSPALTAWTGSPDWSFNKTRWCVDLLAKQAASWRDRARIYSLGKRGRDVGIRRLMAEWVALQLQREGVRLSKGRRGKLARVLVLLYETSGIRVPHDMLDDLEWVFQHVPVEK